jgi:hypothetical protein
VNNFNIQCQRGHLLPQERYFYMLMRLSVHEVAVRFSILVILWHER